MNSFAISCLITAILTIILAVFVVLKRGRLNKLWFFTSISIFLWTIGLFGSVVAKTEKIAYMSQEILYLGTILLIPTLTNYVFALIEFKHKIKNIFLFFIYGLSLIFIVSIFSKSFIVNIVSRNSFGYWPVKTGTIYIYFLLFFFIIFVVDLYLLYLAYKKSVGYRKKQLQYSLYAILIGLIGGSTNFLLDFNLNIYPIGNFFVSLYAVIMTYAIVKYRLMDIRFVISKSILYFILIGFVTLAFTSITFLTGQVFATEGFSTTLISILISLIIVFGLDPLKHFLARITDKVFYKDKIDYREVLKNLGFIIAREIELKKLFVDLSGGLEKSIKCKNVVLLYKNNITGIYRGFESDEVFFTQNDEVIEYLKDKKQIIVVEELDRVAKEKSIEIEKQKLLSIVDRLDKLKIGLIAPIMSDGDITAILCIDRKLSGDTFSEEDIGLISVLTPQIATALEKARLYNEIQAFNVNLQTKIEQATEELKQVNIDLETRNKYLTSLQKISGTITRTLDLSKVIQFIATSIRSEIGFIGGVINFIDENKKNIYIGAMSSDEIIQKAVSVLKDNDIKDNYNLAIKAIKSGKIQKTSYLYDVFRPAINKREAEHIQKFLNVKSIVSLPIYSENKIIGSIDYFLMVNLENIKTADLEVMKSLADQTGLVIGNIRLYEQLSMKNLELEHANEHLKKLDEAKSEFLSIASHQLRTPLTGIKGYLSMILEGDYGKFNSKQGVVLKDVFNATERMTRLINVFLNVTRIESGKLKIDFVDLDISNLVKTSVDLLQISAKDKKLKLNFHADKDIPNIKADQDKIKDVVLNLIDNSIKYTDKGSIDVSVSKLNENEIIVKIKDTGIGLKQHEIDKMFNKFSRGDDSPKINTNGSGLGLYIAKRIVEAHGGKIWVESAGENKGSIFQFTLPIVCI